LCNDAAALRTSLDKLTHITVGPGTANEITADLDEVKTALTTFIDHAGNQWQAQTASLNSALGKLKTAVSDLAASPSSGTVSATATALHEVATAAQNLLNAVKAGCPSLSLGCRATAGRWSVRPMETPGRRGEP